MTTMQEQRQIAVRAVTGTTLDYNGDWEALFDFYSIPQQGGWNGRMLAYINQRLGVTYTNLPGAMQALAVNGGATNFSSLGTFTATIGAAGGPANTVLPLISPASGTVGTLLTVSNGTWNGTPSPTFTYQWRRNGVSIGGETNNTYTVVDADVLNMVRAIVTATNINGVASALSSNTVIPTGTLPANTVAPVASPSTSGVGFVLSVTTGTWTGNPTPTYTYQWQRSGVNIPTATSSTYTTQVADDGFNVRCVVTATNAQGSVSANSNNVPVASGGGIQATKFNVASNSQYVAALFEDI